MVSIRVDEAWMINMRCGSAPMQELSFWSILRPKQHAACGSALDWLSNPNDKQLIHNVREVDTAA